MTGQDIYEYASAFLYERDGDDLDSKEFAVKFINILLQESLEVENSIRKFKGEEVLESAPRITSLTQTIDYDDSITIAALPYGLASFYFQEGTDNYQAENYRAKFLAALQSAAKFNFVDTEDAYG